ncbi:MAG: hypothetical protein HY673_18395 [Chloroflexi bacterium]|nr:hypothetical protein [Chloroflexota bacterium]
MAFTTDHYINLKNGLFDSTSKDDLVHLFSNFSADANSGKMVVHFHGAGNTEESGMAIAERLLPVYRSAGAYPVFFLWESGLLQTITHNLDEIARENIFQLLLKKVAQFAAAKLKQPPGARAAGYLELPTESAIAKELAGPGDGGVPLARLDEIALPADAGLSRTEEQQFTEAVEADPDIELEANRIANSFRKAQDIQAERQATRGARVRGSTVTLMDPAVIGEIDRQATATGQTRGLITTSFVIKHGASVLRRVIERFAHKRSHGLYATIVEELFREFYLANAGTMLWSLMKQDTADAFKDDPDRYGGTAFLELLKTHWQNGGRPGITLVGHSAGTVYICHFLQHAQKRLPPEVKFDVVLLAPACTFTLLSETIQAAGGRLGGFRLFALQDALERSDRLLPVVYPHSILYIVSGILEDEADKPITGMQRFYSGAPPFDASRYPDVAKVRTFLGQQPANLVWAKESSGPGRTSEAYRHSSFDNDPATLASLQHIVSHGF